MNSIKTNLILNTGAIMPIIGLGTWKSAPDKAGEAVEYSLLESGYRHIDCAAIYRNEKEIGEAFIKVFGSGKVKREDIFITSKLWNSEHHKESVRKACERTLADLNLEYLDLYLMHWGVAIPYNDTPTDNPLGRWNEQLDENGFLLTEKVSIRETWEAMEELVQAGLVKAIGVSNFTAPMLNDLISYAKVKPAVNQIELHAYLQQSELVEFCKYNNVVVTAYSPLGSPGNYKDKGFPELIEDKTIKEIANIIRWGIQRGTVLIPKSTTPERIKENIDVFDFELSEEEMKIIQELNRNLRFVNPGIWWKIPYFN
ncbi:MAG: Aldehyde reductase [Candidatus Nomurabacteria bacterium GW2011_GWE1_36_71]|nr:MAG: Aldehyde reductase [Candidatus Nomurabacteria bacterium GW2011_GWE1_36_71]